MKKCELKTLEQELYFLKAKLCSELYRVQLLKAGTKAVHFWADAEKRAWCVAAMSLVFGFH